MPSGISWKNLIKGGFVAWRAGAHFWEAPAYSRALQAEDDARHGYPRPTRPGGYYSESNADASRVSRFIGPDGKITAERPHIHIIHNESEGRIIFTVTQSDGTHPFVEYLPIDASGNEVNSVADRLRVHLR